MVSLLTLSASVILWAICIWYGYLFKSSVRILWVVKKERFKDWQWFLTHRFGLFSTLTRTASITAGVRFWVSLSGLVCHQRLCLHLDISYCPKLIKHIDPTLYGALRRFILRFKMCTEFFLYGLEWSSLPVLFRLNILFWRIHWGFCGVSGHTSAIWALLCTRVNMLALDLISLRVWLILLKGLDRVI